jgi:putative hemolysin
MSTQVLSFKEIAPQLNVPIDFSRLPGSTLARAFDSMLGFTKFNRIYNRASDSSDPARLISNALDILKIELAVESMDLDRIPEKGSLVVVANHPFGILDPLCLIEILLRKRSDVKIITNQMLASIPEIEPICIFVDPFGGADAARSNMRGMKEAIRWLQNGGLVAVFPAGEVSSLTMPRLRIEEKRWTNHLARLVRVGKAATLPIFFHGTNSALFHLGGLVHPVLRTAMIPREMINKRGIRQQVVIGNPIPYSRSSSIESDDDLVAYLRHRTFLLKHRISPKQLKPKKITQTPTNPIVKAKSADSMEAEVSLLPNRNKLLTVGDYEVYHAVASEIPSILQEIGRLREVTFRAVGEGTGAGIDLDIFDQHYTHLFVWSRSKKELVGAYRLGLTDKIFPYRGVEGLYTNTLFKFDSMAIASLNPAIELGRSWVRQEYQRSSIALMLLWRGIGAFVMQYPQYMRLFGPVSISNEYQSISHQMIVGHLQNRCMDEHLAPHFQSRTPFVPELAKDMAKFVAGSSTDDVSTAIADIQKNGKGMPVLIKEYLKMGGRTLAFNVDHSFSDCVDALIMVDLRRTEPKLLEKYIGTGASQMIQLRKAA